MKSQQKKLQETKGKIEDSFDDLDETIVSQNQEQLLSDAERDSTVVDINKPKNRQTIEFHKQSILINKKRAEKYSGLSMFNVTCKGTLHPQVFMKSNYEIDPETRNLLDRKEQWHFCALQQGWFTIVVFLTAMFELMIFAIGFLGSDYQRVTDLDPITDKGWL